MWSGSCAPMCRSLRAAWCPEPRGGPKRTSLSVLMAQLLDSAWEEMIGLTKNDEIAFGGTCGEEGQILPLQAWSVAQPRSTFWRKTARDSASHWQPFHAHARITATGRNWPRSIKGSGSSCSEMRTPPWSCRPRSGRLCLQPSTPRCAILRVSSRSLRTLCGTDRAVATLWQVLLLLLL